jgi:RNA recognition motif-containing protein
VRATSNRKQEKEGEEMTMSKKLYVGNLSYSVDDQALQQKFAEMGAVISAHVVTDRDSGRSKGFGFVEMENDDQANQAVEKFNGQDWMGRAMNVSEARPKTEGSRGGGGGYRGGGGFRGGGGSGRSGGGGGYRGGGSRY